MGVLHDIKCRVCKYKARNQVVTPGAFPPCPRCGGDTTWTPFKPKTDVYGAPTWSWACGKYVGSSHERDEIMRKAGFEPSGDKVGGMRDEGHLNLGATRSYPGQRVRRTLQQRSPNKL